MQHNSENPFFFFVTISSFFFVLSLLLLILLLMLTLLLLLLIGFLFTLLLYERTQEFSDFSFLHDIFDLFAELNLFPLSIQRYFLSFVLIGIKDNECLLFCFEIFIISVLGTFSLISSVNLNIVILSFRFEETGGLLLVLSFSMLFIIGFNCLCFDFIAILLAFSFSLLV